MAKSKVRPGNVRHSAFENEIHLSEFLDFQLNDHAGCYVLQERDSDPYLFKFGFDVEGIHSELAETQFLEKFDKIESGLRSLPFSETMTLHVSSFSESATRIKQLEKLYRQTDDPGIRCLMETEISKVKELRLRGLRQPKRIRLYGTFNPEKMFERRGKDSLETFLASIFDKANTLMGKLDPAVQAKKDRDYIKRVYQEGFKQWKRFFQERLGLKVTPLTADQMWTELWDYFNDSPAPPIPQCIDVTRSGRNDIQLTLRGNPEGLHAASVLNQADDIVDDYEWVSFKKHYCGAMRFIEKPAGWEDEREQLFYLWDLISHADSGDVEIVSQFCPANRELTRKNLQTHSKQASAKDKSSKVSDRNAIKRMEAAQDGEDKMLDGFAPVSVGTVILVHRPDLQKLNDDCDRISAMFQEPCWVGREKRFAWKVFAQCLPTRTDKLLFSNIAEKRHTYALDESMGMLPIISTATPDTSGVEFISRDGSSVFVDLFDPQRPVNMALFGYTRSGKSVLAASFLLQAAASGIPTVAIDYPKGDGSSTFDSMTKIVGGSYFNIADQQNNLFQMFDYRGIPKKRLKYHLAAWRASLRGIVLSLVGESGQIGLDSQIKSVLTSSLHRFLKDPGIRQRYSEATEGGLGSEAWQHTPTLHTFADFMDKTDANKLKQEALDFISLRFEYWLSSDIADAIGKPSSIDTDSHLVVFALTNVTEDEDAAVLGLAAYAAALRLALSHEASIFFIDESPILFQFPLIAKLIAQMTANLGKSGGRVIITAQTVDAIAQTKHAAQILGNCKIKLVGAIEPEQADSYVEHLKLDGRQADLCGSEEFIRKADEDYTHWMLSYGGKKFLVKFYPGSRLLAAVANNPPEAAARKFFMKQLPIDKALDATSNHLAMCNKKSLNIVRSLPKIRKTGGSGGGSGKSLTDATSDNRNKASGTRRQAVKV